MAKMAPHNLVDQLFGQPIDRRDSVPMEIVQSRYWHAAASAP